MKNNELQVFTNSDLGISNFISVYLQGEQIFFCKEIGEALGYTDLSDNVLQCQGLVENIDYVVLKNAKLRELKDLVRLTNVIPLPFNKFSPSLTVLTESGLFALLFRSNKPEAIKIRIWVTSEVLPSIRKHGAYMTPATLDTMLSDPDMAIRLFTELKTERLAKEEAILAKEEAIRTKALIGSKREATAMNTASKAVTKCNKIAAKIGESVLTATTLKVLIKCKEFENKKYADKLVKTLQSRGKHFISVWDKNFDLNLNKPLKDEALKLGVVLHKIEDGRSYKVYTYPAILWKNAYNIDLKKLFGINEELINF